MIRLRPIVVAAATAALALSSPLAHAGGFDKNVPSDAILFVGIDDITAFKHEAAKSGWGKLFGDPGFDPLKEFFAKQMTDVGSEAEKKVGTNPTELLDLVTGGAAFAVLDLSPDIDTKQDRLPGAMAVLLGVGDKGDDFLSRMDVLTESSVSDGKAVRQNEQEGDVDVRVLLDARKEGSDHYVMRYGVKGETFILTMVAEELKDRSYFAELLGKLGDDAGDALAENPSYAKSAAGRGENGIRFYCDVRRLLKMFLDAGEKNGELGEDSKKWVDAFGVRDLGALAASLRLGENGTDAELELPFSGQGWIPRLAHAFFAPGPFKTPQFMPEKPLSMTGFQLHIGPGLDAVRTMLGEVAPKAAERMDESLAKDFKIGEIDMKTEVIDNLTGELGFFTAKVSDELEAMPGSDPDEPINFVAMIGVKEGKRITTAIDAALREEGMAATRKKEEFQGVNVFSVQTPLGSVHYCVLDDWIVASLSDELIKDTLRRTSSQDLPNLAASDEFKKDLERVGASHTYMVTTDAGELAHSMLLNVKSGIEQGRWGVGVAEVGEPALKLDIKAPDPALAKKYLKGSIVAAVSLDDSGLYVRFQSP